MRESLKVKLTEAVADTTAKLSALLASDDVSVRRKRDTVFPCASAAILPKTGAFACGATR